MFDKAELSKEFREVLFPLLDEYFGNKPISKNGLEPGFEDPIYNFNDARVLLNNMPKSTLYMLVNERKIESFKVGGKLAFKKSSLLKYINESCRPSISEIKSQLSK